MADTPFGPYQLVQLLDSGGIDDVWRAYDTETDRTVVVKVLPARFTQDDDFVRRFRHDAELATRLNEAHAMPIHTYGEIDGRLYVDMRLIEGRTLETVLREGPLAPIRAVRIIEQVAQVLHAGHKVGLVHRVVRPSKILLDDDDFAYLSDFGIAWRVHKDVVDSEPKIDILNYIAPERFTASIDIDAMEDVYALACVLYECLTGSPPYHGDSIEQLATGHLIIPPPRPSSSHPNVPSSFDGVIAKGMAKNPDERYRTTLDLAQAARDAATAQPCPEPTDERTDFITQPKGAEITSATKTQPASLIDVTSPVRLSPRATPLPFAELAYPSGVAVDSRGTVYVADSINHQVVALSSGSSTPFVLPFTGLLDPAGVAVDSRGTVYVADSSKDRVVGLAAGSTTQFVMPFTGVGSPADVAVDGDGTVYVTDCANCRVVGLAAAQFVLPFTDLRVPGGVAVDSNRTVYVTDKGTARVMALAAGSTNEFVLPFTGLLDPAGVAVDANGTVYVADYEVHWVVALSPGSTTQKVLPFSDLKMPWGVAVDRDGAVYVTDIDTGRVLKLAMPAK